MKSVKIQSSSLSVFGHISRSATIFLVKYVVQILQMIVKLSELSSNYRETSFAENIHYKTDYIYTILQHQSKRTKAVTHRCFVNKVS